MGLVYSSGMQAALRRLANQNPILIRLNLSQQRMAEELLLQKIMGDKGKVKEQTHHFRVWKV